MPPVGGIRADATLGAVIVAGGAGARLGVEGDKALVPLAGVPMAQHVVDVVARLACRVAVACGSQEQAHRVIAAIQWPVGVEAVPAVDTPGCGMPGPLAGIAAGLRACGLPRCLVVAYDMPFLSGAVLARLDQMAQGHDAAAPRLGPVRAVEPLCAVYSLTCVRTIDALLAAGKAKASSLLESVDSVYLDADECYRLDPSGMGFFNANVPADIEWATGVLRRRDHGGAGHPCRCPDWG